MSAKISRVRTSPFAGQKPGTSGLRKKVSEFMAPHYAENFVQCTLSAVGSDLAGSTLVVGGDGRYGVRDVVGKIIQMAAANGVSRVFSWPYI
jgi:phosphoglucomutase